MRPLGVLHALANEIGQSRFGQDVALVVHDTTANGRVDVTVGVFTQEPPDRGIGGEVGRAPLGRGVKQEGDDRVLGDVLGDVLLGVVGPHLLLVDVLLEDVAEDVGVDLVVGLRADARRGASW